MNEQQARELLPDYLRGFLSTDLTRELERVLAGSAALQRERAELETYFGALDSLSPVKAPVDFLDKLHTRLAKPSRAGRLWHWLVHPAPFKIPLEIAGVAVTCLLIVAIHFPFTKEKPATVAMQTAPAAGEPAVPVVQQKLKEEVSAPPAAVVAKKSIPVRRQDRSRSSAPPPCVVASPAKPTPRPQQTQNEQLTEIAAAPEGYAGAAQPSAAAAPAQESRDEASAPSSSYAMAAAPDIASNKQAITSFSARPSEESRSLAESEPQLISLALTVRQPPQERARKSERRMMAKSSAPAALDAEVMSAAPEAVKGGALPTSQIEGILRKHQAAFESSDAGNSAASTIDYTIDLPAAELPGLKRDLAAIGAISSPADGQSTPADGRVRIHLTVSAQ
jgi:hypothetical protein